MRKSVKKFITAVCLLATLTACAQEPVATVTETESEYVYIPEPETVVSENGEASIIEWKNAYDSGDTYHYLAVSDGNEQKRVLLYEGHSFEARLRCNDIDGDGESEYIVLTAVGASGGYGSYVAGVYKLQNHELVELFYGDYDVDSGFSGRYTNQQLTIENNGKQIVNCKYTDGSIYDDPATDERVNFDSIYSFEPVDIDEDGIYEIKAKQYTWFGSHVNCCGHAISVWKYNTGTGKLEVINADFEVQGNNEQIKAIEQ